MTKRAGLRSTRKQGRSYKYLVCSYDQSSQRAFDVIGRMAQDAQRDWQTLSIDEKMKLVQTLAPIALKRVPDRVEQISYNMQLSDELIERLLYITGKKAHATVPPPDVYVLTEPDAPSKPSNT